MEIKQPFRPQFIKNVAITEHMSKEKASKLIGDLHNYDNYGIENGGSNYDFKSETKSKP